VVATVCVVRSVGVDIGSVGRVDFGVVVVILSVDINVVCVGEVGVSVVPVVVFSTQEAALFNATFNNISAIS
jgi:hypothetical protein